MAFIGHTYDYLRLGIEQIIITGVQHLAVFSTSLFYCWISDLFLIIQIDASLSLLPYVE